MTVCSETETEILRLAFHEQWPIGTISKHLRVHRSVVERVLFQFKNPPSKKMKHSKMIENHIHFIEEIIEKYPGIHASRLFVMMKKRGYQGRSASYFRKNIAKLRPQKTREAFARLSTLPGEQAQVDWADFGKISVGKATHKLMAFVMTLSWSRAIFLKFFFSAKMAFFQQGFVDAFDFFEGSPHVILHDNLKSGVIERVGSIVRFNQDFIDISKYYLFEPRAVNIRRGNEKGKVERSIRYIRDNFFSGRTFTTLEQFNKEALDWCLNESLDRIWRRGENILVREAFQNEKKNLNPLPHTPFPAQEQVKVKIGKTPFARFYTNDYSVPMECVEKSLDIVATHTTIKIIDEIKIVAIHPRSWGKYETIEDPEHQAILRRRKKKSVTHSGLARFISAVPEGELFVSGLAERGKNLGGSICSLLKLLDLYGKNKLSQAVKEVLESGAICLGNVHHVLKRIETDTQDHTPLLGMNLPAKYSDISVVHHDLSHYDKISEDKYEK